MSWYIGLYEKTGIMASEWVAGGHRALCVDIDCEPGERDGVLFIRDDMLSWVPPRHVVEEGCCFLAAFPPCTHLAVSGARWFKGKGLGALADSIRLFERAAFWAEWFGAPYLIENPVSTISTYWREPDRTFEPYHFAGHCPDDNYTKKTCLWTGNGFHFPQYKQLSVLELPDSRIFTAPPGDERADFRSATPRGFARAVFLANNPINDDPELAATVWAAMGETA